MFVLLSLCLFCFINIALSLGLCVNPTFIIWSIFYVGAGLRNRSLENKAVIVSEVEKNVWPAIEAGMVKPVVYKSLPLSEAAEAHRLMESSKHIGKILLLP